MSRERLNMGLAKQMRFAAEYVKDLNATAAYKRAGYEDSENAQYNASRMTRYDKVKAEINRLMTIAAAKLDITKEKQALKLEHAQAMALEAKETSNYIRAVEVQSKHFGLMADKLITEQSAEEKELTELERKENKRMARLMLIDAHTGTRIDQDGQTDVKAG